MTGPPDVPPDFVAVKLPSFRDLIDRHAPFDWEVRYGTGDPAELAAGIKGGRHLATVVSFDLRKSTRLAQEAGDRAVFATQLNKLLFYSWWMIRGTGGWYDKFTGDGFIAYRLHGPEAGDGWEPNDGKPARGLAAMLGIVEVIRGLFHRLVLPELQANSANWPHDAGLAVGIDAGSGELRVFVDDLTIFGPAVVGATRMVEAAHQDEIVVNVNLGLRLERQIGDGVWGDWLEIEKATRTTKEYPEHGQDVYLLRVKHADHVMEASGERFPMLDFEPPVPPGTPRGLA
jgi:class 3 adenylate cyclase